MFEKVTVTDAMAEDIDKLRPRLKNVHIRELVVAIIIMPKTQKPTFTCVQRAASPGDGTHLHLLFFLLTVFQQLNIWCLEEGVSLYNLHRSPIMCQRQPTYVKAYEGLLHN